MHWLGHTYKYIYNDSREHTIITHSAHMSSDHVPSITKKTPKSGHRITNVVFRKD